MSVKFGLLALLAEAPTHGYQLKTAFERRTGGSWALNIGQVYTTLQRLERDGLVESRRPTDDRHDYRITAVGRDAARCLVRARRSSPRRRRATS